MKKIKQALISVSDKNKLKLILKILKKFKIKIISSGGTYKKIKKLGYKCNEVSKFTNSSEILDGRVKTLHPKIHAGILNKRNNKSHKKQMRLKKYENIDLVIVNFYPFEKTLAKTKNHKNIIENIDIGGPTLVRAAAKNFDDVLVVTSPKNYINIIDEINKYKGSTSLNFRKQMAINAFNEIANYDSIIANYFNDKFDIKFPNKKTFTGKLVENLRYGENPHQKAATYKTAKTSSNTLIGSNVHQGKELSYNNLLDANAAIQCVQSFSQPACVIVKHVNPCGVAIGNDLNEAYEKSFQTDPESAFGGVISVNQNVDQRLAAKIINNQFLEILIAPSFSSDALQELANKKNIRVIEMDDLNKHPVDFVIQSIGEDFLIQENDEKELQQTDLNIVTKKQPTELEIQDMLFAWKVVKYVKSNAIVFAREQKTIGIGAGQMSRVMSAKIASLKAATADLDTNNCIMASDGFFPFKDSIEMASKYGIHCVIQPGGSIKDDEVIEAANKKDMVMAFTGIRHFRH